MMSFRRCVDIKIRGTYLCTKAVAKVLIAQRQGGKVVNVRRWREVGV